MFLYDSFDSIKKAAVLFLLLTHPLGVFAESSDLNVTKSEVSDGAVVQEGQGEPNFQPWPPVRRQSMKDEVPPPPPGPYMSLGLNDFPVGEPAFSSNSNKPQVELDPSGVPIQTFSPDVPWPKNIRPTKRWMPENGYQYVKPQTEMKHYPVTQSSPANNYNYVYPGSPYMGWPGSNWAPPMAARPYRNAPDYGPGYRSNDRIQQGGPNYRTTYPSPRNP